MIISTLKDVNRENRTRGHEARRRIRTRQALGMLEV